MLPDRTPVWLRGDWCEFVGSDFWTDPKQCGWRIIAPTLTGFVAALGVRAPWHTAAGHSAIMSDDLLGAAASSINSAAASAPSSWSHAASQVPSQDEHAVPRISGSG
jgi:hypothetical protein